jgi:hypothetical protein
MKKTMMMMLMLMMLCKVNSYAWKGIFCCCDCDEVEGPSLNRAPLVPKLGSKYISSFEKFKEYYTADGDCEMRPPHAGSIIEIKEKLRAGRGQKIVVFEGLNIWQQRVRPDRYLYIQFIGERGTVIRKGSIIDCERGAIYHPDGRPSYLQKY